MDNFQSFCLSASLYKSLDKVNITKPTEVQQQAIPQATEGKDVIVSAPTGTGKTLAFVVPILDRLIRHTCEGGIIVTPTREIATQVHSVIKPLLSFEKDIKAALLIGGSDMSKQLKQLQNKPRLIIGTPGRINDHIKRKSLKLDKVDMIVLDEMDRMLDMGFSEDIDKIFGKVSQNKQVMMFSATIAPSIVRISQKYLNNPVTITVEGEEKVNTNVKQNFAHIKSEEKYDTLVEKLKKDPFETSIIFVKTKKGTESLAKKLSKDSFSTKAIHGDLRQAQREKIISRLRKKEYNVIVATDVAARGIDVPHIKYVINYNIPTKAEDYVHRVGRTGRAGQEGEALTLVSSDEKKEWRALECYLDPSKKEKRNSSGGKGRGDKNKSRFKSRKKAGSKDHSKKSGEQSRRNSASAQKRNSKPNNGKKLFSKKAA